jgi:acyl-coenzyme A synthetase/AMP-(fatty) acid ligase
MSHNFISLFSNLSSENYLDSGFAFFQGKIISRTTFLKHVTALAQDLPQSEKIINLCEDRYLFSVVFIASMVTNKICLLPSSQVDSEINNLKEEYDHCISVYDQDISLEALDLYNAKNIESPRLKLNQIACIVFTSGSTGKPKANEKTWGSLLASAQLVASSLGLDDGKRHNIVATVPAQHMFGFEMSIMLPMVSTILVHSGKPFFPQEVCHAMSELSGKSILITTPIHLKACVAADIKWPEIEFVLSATSTLESNLAIEAESKLKTNVKEIYGCSEAGAIASREVSKSEFWDLLPGYEIKQKNSGYELVISKLQMIVGLHDNFEFNDKGQFLLLGRESDMIKVAGKRGSLGDLKNKICSITGVDDAVFFMPDFNIGRGRLAALVISSDIGEHEIVASLSKRIDPVFLPRPLIKVSTIPYDSIGKISRNKLIEIYKQYKKNRNSVQSV